jgi:hypothetical protein
MDNREKLAKTESAIKNGQSRETGKDRISNQKWTIQRNWQRPNQQSKMDNPEKLAKTESAIKNGQSRETDKDRISNQKWTIQRNWQHRVHKTNKNTTQYVFDTTMRKQTQIT